MPAASVAHPLDPATYLLRGGPLTSGLQNLYPDPRVSAPIRKSRYLSFLSMAQLLSRFSVGAVGVRTLTPSNSQRTRALGHLTPRPGGLPLGYIRESAACASTHTLGGWVVACSWPFWASTTLPDASACRSLLAHLCQHAIKRGEHRLVIESDGALLGSRCGVRFAFGVGGGIHVWRASGWSPPRTGKGSLVEAVTANVFGRSPRGRPWCAVIGLRFVSFGDGARSAPGCPQCRPRKSLSRPREAKTLISAA